MNQERRGERERETERGSEKRVNARECWGRKMGRQQINTNNNDKKSYQGTPFRDGDWSEVNTILRWR